jgi:hypothetical protein
VWWLLAQHSYCRLVLFIQALGLANDTAWLLARKIHLAAAGAT